MPETKHRSGVRQRRTMALLSAVAATPLIASAANTDNFIGTSGQNWNTASHWNTTLVPTTGDTVNIVINPLGQFSVTFDGSYSAATAIGFLTLDGSSTSGVVLNQGNALESLFSGTETVGNNGIATFNQTAATNSMTGTLFIGNNASGNGTYLLGVGTSLIAPTINVGFNGRGTFTQSGGTVATSTSLFVGNNGGSSGIYTLTGGSVNASNATLTVGNNGSAGPPGPSSGSFVQSAGLATFSILNLGNQSAANGLYSLSGTGSLTVGGNEFIANQGTGNFVESGGAHTNNTETFIGNSLGSTGSYSLSSGMLSTQIVSIGTAGTGSFAQQGGTHSITSNLILGDQATGVGSYNLSGGLLQSPSNGSEYIGLNGTGSFIQTAGSNNLSTNFLSSIVDLGVGGTGQGLYSLSGTGSLTAFGIHVGESSRGTFVQSGGAVTIGSGGFVSVGIFSGSSGIYQLSAGSINAASATLILGGEQALGTLPAAVGSMIQSGGTATFGGFEVGSSGGAFGLYSLSGTGSLSVSGNEYIGHLGIGSFIQSGGANTITPGDLSVGDQSSAAGLYNMSAGSLSAPGQLIGNLGVGTFIQSGGVNTVAGTLTLGNVGGSQGTYSLSLTGTLTVGGLNAGFGGRGTLIQSGGTLNSSGTILVGSNAGSSGIYSMSGGSINAAGTSLTLGSLGPSGTLAGGIGSFIQSGGIARFAAVNLGFNTGSSGFYSLSSTGSLAVNNIEFVGVSGIGSFVQSGGTHTIANNLYVGGLSGSVGNYAFSGGSLAMTGTFGVEYVGYSGTGSFTQTGGNNSTTGQIDIGTISTGNGIYSLGPGGTLSPANGVIIGDAGRGTFIQSGGTNNATTLWLGFTTGGSGVYQLSGGNLAVPGTAYIGVSGPSGTLPGAIGSIVQTGGTATFGDIPIGDAIGSSGLYSLSNGSVTTSALGVGGEFSAPGGSGVLNISGGTMTVTSIFGFWNTPGTSITLSGGTLNLASIVASGAPASLFNWTGGTLNLTAGATIDANFPLGSSFNLNATKTLLTGATLTNNGQITMSGGALGGAGQIVNSTGQISGFGTIDGSGGFVNNGNITQSGGNLVLSNTGANSNTGNIDLAVGNQLQLNGGSLANSGTINLNGGTVSGGAQLNNSASGVLAGPGTISAPLTNNGTVALTAGTLNLPPFTNNGIVAPGGVTANMTGGAISNASTIQGFGKINNNVTNTGTIEAAGGTLIFSGTIANSAGGILTASSGNKLLFTSGLGPNAGLISLTGGTIDTNNTTFTNNATVSGYGALRTGGLTNASELELTGGTATVTGPVTNNAGARVDVKFSTAVFNSPVTNNGTFKITGGSVSFVSTFTNNGTYSSDPADNYFTDLNIATTGALVGGVGDRFFIRGNFTNNSTQNSVWNIAAATVDLQGSGLHSFSVTGVDQGLTYDGYINNFAIGTLAVDADASLALQPAAAGSALYVGALELAGGLGQIGAIAGNRVSIYYDPTNAANAYLADQSYGLAGGGQIAPVPEPGTGLLGVLAALLCRNLLRRNRITVLSS